MLIQAILILNLLFGLIDMEKNHYVRGTDGCWYYERTYWKFVLDSLCDALGYFSEADSDSHPIYLMIDQCANQVTDVIISLLKSNEL